MIDLALFLVATSKWSLLRIFLRICQLIYRLTLLFLEYVTLPACQWILIWIYQCIYKLTVFLLGYVTLLVIYLVFASQYFCKLILKWICQCIVYLIDYVVVLAWIFLFVASVVIFFVGMFHVLCEVFWRWRLQRLYGHMNGYSIEQFMELNDHPIPWLIAPVTKPKSEERPNARKNRRKKKKHPINRPSQLPRILRSKPCIKQSV